MRLGIVALFFVAGACATGALFVAPSLFVVILQEKSLRAERVAQEQYTTTNASTLEAVLKQADQKLSILAAKYAHPSVTDLIKVITEIKPLGVTITSFQYVHPHGKAGVLAISGTSATRDALVLFEEALEKESRITDVQLPISNLANNTNLSFTITVTVASSSLSYI